jgi:hypothetical protein
VFSRASKMAEDIVPCFVEHVKFFDRASRCRAALKGSWRNRLMYPLLRWASYSHSSRPQWSIRIVLCCISRTQKVITFTMRRRFHPQVFGRHKSVACSGISEFGQFGRLWKTLVSLRHKSVACSCLEPFFKSVFSVFCMFFLKAAVKVDDRTLRVYYKSSCLGSHTHWPCNKDTTQLTSLEFRAYSLHEACKVGCLVCVKHLLNTGVLVNYPSLTQGYTDLDFSNYVLQKCSSSTLASLHQSVSKYLVSQGGTCGRGFLKRFQV